MLHAAACTRCPVGNRLCCVLLLLLLLLALLHAVLPLQISQAYIAGDKSYGRVTMANIAPSSSIMWCAGAVSQFL
jgi:succinate dehydrogenase hydrophobic anchor subunit